MSALAPNLRYALFGVYGVLMAATAISATIARWRPRLDLTEIKQRIRSWWMMAGLFTVALVLHPTVSILFFGVVSVLAVREFLRMLPAGDRAAGLVAYPVAALQYGLVAFGALELVVIAPMVAALAVPAVLAVGGRTEGFIAATGSVLLGIALTVFAVGHGAYLIALPEAAAAPAGAAGLLVFLVVLTEANDVAQFLWGKALGTRPVAPRVSPGKTVEGLAGGGLTTVALAAGLTPLLTPFSVPMGAVVGGALALAGFVGDITISAVKRDAGVKDTGTLLPGHGGVLDRVDSLIFTAPLFFHFLRLVGG